VAQPQNGFVPERYARNMRTFSLADQAALLNRLSPSQWSEEDKRRLRAGLADQPPGPDQPDQAD
jgi:hypothetical protein